MAKDKKHKPNKNCSFLVQVPHSLRLSFKKECYKQRRSAKSAIEIFMEALTTGQIILLNHGLKIKKKKVK